MEGLDKFREAFAAFSDNYVIIGGTACEITMQESAMRPRATHNIDMIVIVENMTAEFADRFWQFVKEAGYRPERRRGEEGDRTRYELYRFVDGKNGYPEKIELLSRHPDTLGEPKGFVIEPLIVGEDVSSLSAIIMDDDYYRYTIDNSRLSDGIRHAEPVALVALKTRAYLNLMAARSEGRQVNGRDIRKHRSDVLKNVFLIAEDSVPAPESICDCAKEFVDSIRGDWDNLARPLATALGVSEKTVIELLDKLEKLFSPENL